MHPFAVPFPIPFIPGVSTPILDLREIFETHPELDDLLTDVNGEPMLAQPLEDFDPIVLPPNPPLVGVELNPGPLTERMFWDGFSGGDNIFGIRIVSTDPLQIIHKVVVPPISNHVLPQHFLAPAAESHSVYLRYPIPQIHPAR